jgi:hypothetical protein
VAICAALATTGCSSSRQAVGQDNGALNSNAFAASSTPDLTLETADRHPHIRDQGIPLAVNQHLYPPTAR